MLPAHFNGHARRYGEHADKITEAAKRRDEAQNAAIVEALDSIERDRVDLDATRASEAASKAPEAPA